jgi:hypothetical protein
MGSTITALAFAAGRLLGPAFACGLNLYATVAALGIASRLGLAGTLPVGLRGLEHGLIIGSAIALYLIEFVVDKIRFADSAWDAAHTVIRPAAAALLTVLALDGAVPQWQLAAAAVLAGFVALGAHTLKAGLRVALNRRPGRARAIATSLLEDVLAVTIALTALLTPHTAMAVAAALLLLVVLVGPRLLRPALLAIRALHASLAGLLGGGRRWRTGEELPAGLRQLLAPTPLGAAPARAVRVALLAGNAAAGAYRDGWLVLEPAGAAFLYRTTLGRGRRLPITRVRTANISAGLLADTLDIVTDDCTWTMLLLKNGPSPDLTRTELLTEAT